LDLDELQQNYRTLQKKLHPDRFHRKSEKEKSFSRDQSASLNNAFKVLSNDLLRAQYLLSLNGVDVLAEGKNLVDPVVLSEILESREELDSSEKLEEVTQIAQNNEQKYNQTVETLKQNFESNDFEAAKRNTIYLQYLSKIKEECEQRILHLSKEN